MSKQVHSICVREKYHDCISPIFTIIYSVFNQLTNFILIFRQKSPQTFVEFKGSKFVEFKGSKFVEFKGSKFVEFKGSKFVSRRYCARIETRPEYQLS